MTLIVLEGDRYSLLITKKFELIILFEKNNNFLGPITSLLEYIKEPKFTRLVISDKSYIIEVKDTELPDIMEDYVIGESELSSKTIEILRVVISKIISTSNINELGEMA